jgi:hypothetical protein
MLPSFVFRKLLIFSRLLCKPITTIFFAIVLKWASAGYLIVSPACILEKTGCWDH